MPATEKLTLLFCAAHPSETRWISENKESNPFARSLHNGLKRFGSLTGPQLAAVRRNIRKELDNGS